MEPTKLIEETAGLILHLRVMQLQPAHAIAVLEMTLAAIRAEVQPSVIKNSTLQFVDMSPTTN